MITISCSTCQKKLSVKEDLAGKKVKCPGCGQLTVVPARVVAAVGMDQRTLPPSLGNAPSQDQNEPATGDLPTHPPLDKPDATQGVTADAGHDTSLTDFLAPPQADDELGRLGAFRILKILGHGGMGVVFLGEDAKLSRKVAIKAMLPHLAQSKSSQQRFLREARAAAALEHDHIVAIHHVGEDRGAPYIVMPFLKGQPLDERLKADMQMPLADILRIGREVAEGLGAAHAMGLIHRDIKPANIWLEAPRDRVKILDFGLARATTQEAGLTQQGAIIGTPAYMSPEQGRGAEVDHRCDLFSLGVVLYRMCTGQQPFHGKDTVSTLMAVAMNEPVAPIKLNSELPPELSDLVMKLLEKDIDKRVSSAAEVIQTVLGMEKKLAMQKMAEDKTEAMNAGDPKHGIVTTPRGKAARNVASRSEEPSTADLGPRQRSRRPLVLAAVLFAIVILGGAGTWALVQMGVIRISTADGDFVVDTDDPDFKFSVSKGAVILEDVKTKRTYKLKAERKGNGEYELDVTDVGADLSFKVKQFTIKRGEQFALKATFEPRQVAGAFPPLDPAWLKMVAALPAEKQVDAVGDKLKERNPGFDGKIYDHKIEAGVVTQLRLSANMVTDVSPVRALIGLKVFQCYGGAPGKGLLSDLSPLKDMKLTMLSVGNTKLSDLSPLKHMGLRSLAFNGTPVSDLSPLKDMKLTILHLANTQVTDLSPLKDMKLTTLGCKDTLVTDLSPLRGMPLNALECNVSVAKRNSEILLSIKMLETINGKPAAQFWKEVDGTSSPPTGNYVLRFDGKSSYVAIPSLRRDDPVPPVTMEAWVMADQEIVGTAHRAVIVLGGMSRYQLEQIGPNWVANDQWLGRRLRGPLQKGQWVHLAFVADAKNIAFYVDGKEVGREPRSRTSNGRVTDVTHSWIGGHSNDKDDTVKWLFSGLIDEVRISKVARYDKNFTPAKRFETDPETVALYHFDEGAGDVLKDSSGNEHHGKIVGAKWVKGEGLPSTFPPLDPAWLKAVAAMKAEPQVEAVKAELMKRNPGFDGKDLKYKLDADNSRVRELFFTSANVTDISPVRGLKHLLRLECGGPRGGSKLADLSPLKGMGLWSISVHDTQVADLSPLEGMDLRWVDVRTTPVANLAALKNMKNLLSVSCAGTSVSDLAPLKGMRLEAFYGSQSKITDLSPLAGMQLTQCHFDGAAVTDFTPLKGMPLHAISGPFQRGRDDGFLRGFSMLKTINGKPANQFWKEASAPPPLDPAWLKAVAGMTPDKQVEAVKAELMKRNPVFDGTFDDHKIQEGHVTILKFLTDDVQDISPVRACRLGGHSEFFLRKEP